jgi:hypothetical protein
MRGLFGVAGALVVLVGGAAGQDAVTFKKYPYKVGDKTRTNRTTENTGTSTVILMGKEMKTSVREKQTWVFVTEVVELGPDPTRPAKLRRTYEKAVEEVKGTEQKLWLDGKTVLILRKGAKTEFAEADGKLLGPLHIPELTEEFGGGGRFEDQFLPDRPLKPGESWDLTEKFPKDSSTRFPLDKSAKVSGKLVSVMKRGAATFGDVRMTADLPMTIPPEKSEITLLPGSYLKIEVSLSICLDGSSPEGETTTSIRQRFGTKRPGLEQSGEGEQTKSTRTERVGGEPR